MIETRRLRIHVASQDEMKRFIETQIVDILKAAYTEILRDCLNYPDQWQWYAIWIIELKDGTHIGELCFKDLIQTALLKSDMEYLKNTRIMVMQLKQ